MMVQYLYSTITRPMASNIMPQSPWNSIEEKGEQSLDEDMMHMKS